MSHVAQQLATPTGQYGQTNAGQAGTQRLGGQQSGSQQVGGQQPGGQQFGSQHQAGTTPDAGTLPQQTRQALDQVARAVQVCGWCADKCIETADPHMIECIRLCEDVVEIGETLLAVAPRSSRFTTDVAQTFAQAARACAQECGRHSQSHCQECASLLPQAAQSAQQLSTTGQGMGGGTGQQMGAAGGQQFAQ